jgi:hypothetical protein
VNGSVVSQSLPAFNAYSIIKLTGRPGRGSDGHIRISGVPELNQDDATVDPLVLAAMQAACSAGGAFDITGGAGTDFLTPVVFNGKAVNLAPGGSPSSYTDVVSAYRVATLLTSQITRKRGRRRR